MYCKDCKFRSEPDKHDPHPFCTNERLIEDDYSVRYQSEGNRLIYSYYEGGIFYVEDYFGCVHFELLDTATWRDLAEQAESFQKRVSSLESKLKDIREKCTHPNLPVRQLGEEFMDVCPDCGFVSYYYIL